MNTTTDKRPEAATPERGNTQSNRLTIPENGFQSNLEAAFFYASNGWAVFPCKADKSPWTPRGCRDASTDPSVIKTWWNTHPRADVGVATGDGLLVVDLDPRGEKGDGLEQWAALVEQHGGAPETLTATTPSGGRHLYFRVECETRNTQGKLAPQIDTRGSGGYVIAPGAGPGREWLNPDCAAASAPDWLVDLISAKPAPSPVPAPAPVPAGSDAVARARAYMAKVPSAISGEGGHDKTFHVASVLVEGFGLGREDALALLREYSTRCLPPWSEKELQHKVDSALERLDPAQRGHLLRAGDRGAAGPSTATAHGDGATEQFFVLPGGAVSITSSGEALFTRLAGTGDYFLHGGQVVRRAASGLEPVLPEQLRSIPESFFGRVVAERAGRNGEPALVPRTMPTDTAKALLACDAKRMLPEVRIIVRQPVILPDGRTLPTGLDPATGIFIESADPLPDVTLDDALLLLADLLEDFRFVCQGDYARAMAAILTPALRMGGFLRLCPLLVVEADQSQTGKTFLLKLIFTIYGETPRTIAQRNGGVGSFDESLASALLAGRPFITFDNLRGKVDSQYLEALLTEESAIDVRVPHKGSVPVDPSRFVLSATSNAASMTKDLANRSYFVRLQRKPDGYQFQSFPEGDLLDHVRANRGRYLAAVHSVLRQWIADGSRTTATTDHDFRQWARTLEHIVGEYFFQSVDFFQGMKEARARVSDPAGGFIRELALLAFRAGGSGRAWTAGELAELAEDNGVTQGSGRPATDKVVGRLLGRMFGDGDKVQIEGLTIERATHEGNRQTGQPFTQKVYKFSGCNNVITQST